MGDDATVPDGQGDSDSESGDTSSKKVSPVLETVYVVWVRYKTHEGYEPYFNSFITGRSENEAIVNFFGEKDNPLNVVSLRVEREWRVVGWKEV